LTRLEYLLASSVLRVLGRLFARLPAKPGRVILASPRKSHLDGNLLAIHGAIREIRPGADERVLTEPYSYGFVGKLRYAVRVARGMYHLRTAGLVFVDNAWLPVHVGAHPRTTVVQVWHATGALKRFGLDSNPPPGEPERSFLHRGYDWVITSGDASRDPWSRALGTPLDHVLALGSARTDELLDPNALAAARERVLAKYPALRDRRVITYAPTFRGRGRGKRPAPGLDAAKLRAALEPGDVLALKSHPNLNASLVSIAGFDVVIAPSDDMNDVLAATDVLITDYSSSIFEWALLRRPLILLVPDLAEYESEPGLYVDYGSGMIGTQVADTDGAIEALRRIEAGDVDLSGYEAFIARHLGASDGHASRRIVEQFVPADLA
jgi:CDP-ribitol ribitolphosphotransferase